MTRRMTKTTKDKNQERTNLDIVDRIKLILGK